MENTQPCNFCDQQVMVKGRPDKSGHDVTCPRCGSYTLDLDALLELKAHPLEPRIKANASGWIREYGAAPVIDRDRLDFFHHRLQPLSVGERAERLMRLLAKQFPLLAYDNVLDIQNPEVCGATWSASSEEVFYLLVDYLGKARGLVKCDALGGSSFQVVILPPGWEYIESLKSPNAESHQGFIAMWFDPSVEELRRKGIIAGIRGAGFKEFIIDQHLSNEHIMDEILAAIRRSRFVVADHTGNRHNIYYEAGFAHGLKIPVIRTCRKDEIGKVTFDVNHYPFILWEPDKLDELATRLKNHIQATIGVGPFVSEPSSAVTS